MSARNSLRWVEDHQTAFAWMVLGAGMVAAAALFLHLQRDLFYVSDESTWLFTAGTGNLADFLRPDNGHLTVLNLAAGRVILETLGDGYAAFTVAGVLGALAAAATLFEYGRRRVGPLLALPPALLVLFFGSGWSQLLQGWIGMSLMWPLAFGLGALILAELERTWADVGAMLLLAFALASFSTGLAFAAGVAVTVAFGSRGSWRRHYVWAVPAVLYLAWRIWALKFGEHEGAVSNLLWLPGYAVDWLSVTVFGAFGRVTLLAPGQVTALHLSGFDFNRFASAVVWSGVVLVALLFAARALWRRGLNRALLAALAVLVVLWIAQDYGLSPERTPAELRYLLPNAFVLLIVLLAACEGIRPSRLAWLSLAILVPVAVIGMLPDLKEWRGNLAAYSRDARADLAVFELGGRNVDADFVPATSAPGIGASALFISPAGYREIASRYGSLAMTPAELKRAPEEVRRKADGVYARALGVAAVPQPGFHGCPRAQTGTGPVALPRGGALVRASATSPFSLRRFGAGFGVPVGGLPGGEFARIVIPADRDPAPWVLRAPAGGALVACPIPAS